MKKTGKTLLSLCFAAVICCVFTLCGRAAVKNTVQLPGESTDNASDNNYAIRSSTMRSFLAQSADGTLTRVEATGDSTVLIETYSADGATKISGKTLDFELPVFGGFFSGMDHNYLVFGQNNPEESNSVEIMRVVQYSKSWQRLNSGSVYGANTYIPFTSGSLRMTEAGGKLYIETCHQMYESGDGKHHQANMYFRVNESSMQIEDSFSGVMNISCYGYVSHSFNQFIATDGAYVYRADHGDAYPRGISINRFSVSASTAHYVDYTIPLYFVGDTGVNSTGATLGGMALSDDRVLLAASIDDQTGEYSHFTDYDYKQHNIILISASKTLADSENRIRYVTGYKEGDGVGVRTPQLVKVSADRFLLLWEEQNAETEAIVVRAVLTDGAGTLQTQIYTLEARLSDCQPILTADGCVTWYAGTDGAALLYKVDPQNIGSFVTGYHNWDAGVPQKAATATENGTAQFTCLVCGKVEKRTVWAASDITLSPDTFVYDGEWHTPDTVTVRDSKGNLLKKNVDYTCINYMYSSFGTFFLTIEGTGLYAYSVQKPFSIVPATPTGFTAQANGNGAAKLTWNEVPEATVYRVYRYSGETKQYVLEGETENCAYNVTGLSGGVTYYFRVRAVYKTYFDDVASGYSAAASVKTTGAPAVPANVKAAAYGSNGIRLTWTASPGATQYNIYRYNGTSKQYVYIGTAYKAAYYDGGRSAGVTYYYKITAVDKSTGTAVVSEKSAAASAKAVFIPAVPANVKAAAYGKNGIRLTWTASAGATQYNIYRYNGTKKAYVYIGTAYKAAYYDGGRSVGVTYYYKITAVDKSTGTAAVSAKSAAASATAVGTPAVPKNVKAAAYGKNGIRLTWTASPGATQYNIYRYNGTKKAYVYIGTAYKAAYYDGGRSVGSAYYYKVTAVCKTSVSTFVSAQSAAVNAKAVGIPVVPRDLKAAACRTNVIRLTWKASPGATQYNIYRYNGTKKAYVYIGTAYKPTYLDSGRQTGITYYYKITAVCKTSVSTFVSAQSAAVNAKALFVPAVPANVKAAAYGANGIHLTWTASSGATQYNIYRYNGAKKAYLYIGTSYKAAYYDGGRTVGVTYYYKITAVDKSTGDTAVSDRSAAADAKAVGVPVAPKNVKAAPYGANGIRLTWTASPGATQYNIYRYNSTKKAYVYVGTAYKAAYYDGGRSVGGTYYYKIRAVCKAIVSTFVSEQSAAVSAKAVGTPAVPRNVKAAPYGQKGVRLTWTASPGATQYNIYRYNSTKKAYVYVGTAFKTAFYNGGLNTGTTYYYKVCAVCKASVSTFVSELSAYASAKAD